MISEIIEVVSVKLEKILSWDTQKSTHNSFRGSLIDSEPISSLWAENLLTASLLQILCSNIQFSKKYRHRQIIYIYIYTQPLHTSRMRHKVSF